ncbi:D-glycero-beta-D-manno-heptose 1-phosphate adenylyltransferase [Neolewinella agarilytica]|uniref:D-glycero-beta-D-manno-heptose 1-phosphate adenylyltransferase n=1 Tax=Neolewinella agarilytica TaxID=478744 RepID=A0A1H9LA28_9BACT|nr:D-glycero-beta-D-manno-heptose 1-phosphate adenylyltransferase [Neolewinella agarilytica]SER08057.1 D-beta-D-heptose 7-phosphate kinase / D-beta-D-heptose 1-phosphate adenosyltransferase [Neolewinella agarilytica]
MTETELVQDKLLPLVELSRRRCGWRTYSQDTVFTNGVFDLIHPGHLTYLAEAAALGQRLIVGVNSDESVKRLKGDCRPIMPLAARMQLLAGLFYVDGVIAFDEDTPLELIKSLRPDVLVKGGDYQVDEIVGAKEVRAWGGDVRVLPFLEGYSSTRIIERMQGISI